MSNDKLFTPLRVGNMNLAHRFAMAPLTRLRSTDAPAHIPLPMVATHYAQRSVVPGTLIISEGTHPFPSGAGYRCAPGIWSAEQVSAWRASADAVHANGSFIFMQLWACGRTANPKVIAKHGNKAFLQGPSAIPISEKHQTPTALSEEQIWEVIRDFAQAAKNAVEAGMDGVEIHGANGYLIDQFLQPNSNHRTDTWGGSVEKRARFAFEVAKAIADAIGPEKVGMRFSPWTAIQGLGMEDPHEQFLCAINKIKPLGLAYLHLVEPRVGGERDVENPKGDNSRFIEAWGDGVVFLAGGFTPDSARKLVNVELPDKNIVVVVGRLWTSNPDFVYRVKKGIPLVKYDRSTFYNQKEERGYITWPFSTEFQREHGSRL